MAGVSKFTAEEVIKALQESQGLPALAADRLGCTAQTVYNYRDRYRSVAEAMHHQKEKRIDFAEGKLWQNIGNNDTTAIIFFLKCQAKSRGYVERTEISGAEGQPLQGPQVTIYMPSNDRN